MPQIASGLGARAAGASQIASGFDAGVAELWQIASGLLAGVAEVPRTAAGSYAGGAEVSRMASRFPVGVAEVKCREWRRDSGAGRGRGPERGRRTGAFESFFPATPVCGCTCLPAALGAGFAEALHIATGSRAGFAEALHIASGLRAGGGPSGQLGKSRFAQTRRAARARNNGKGQRRGTRIWLRETKIGWRKPGAPRALDPTEHARGRHQRHGTEALS